jgi:hypothetical protein
MGSLIRATNLWGYSALVRDLGAIRGTCSPGSSDSRRLDPAHTSARHSSATAGSIESCRSI